MSVDREEVADVRPVTLARWRRLFHFVRPSLGRLSVVLLAILISAVLGLLGPVWIERLLNRAVEARLDFESLVTITTLMVGTQILAIAMGILQELQLGRVSTAVLFRMRRAFFDHLFVLPMRHLAKTKMGDVLTRLTRDLSDAQGAFLTTVLALFSSVFTIVGSIVVMAHYNVRLLGLLLIVAIPVALVTRFFRRSLRERTADVRKTNETIASFLVESFTGMKETRALGRERRRSLSFVRLQHELTRRVMRSIGTGAFAAAVPNAIVTLASIGIFYYGGVLVVRGEERIGDLVAFAALQARVFGPLRGLVGLYQQLLRAGVGVDRVFEYLDMTPEVADAPHATAIERPLGDITFRNVRFAYEPEKSVLDGVSFTIPRGRLTAIVGRNGSGKSTIIDLILRHYRTTEGEIAIGGRSLDLLTRRSLIRAIAVAPQDPMLFHATMRENIAFGRIGASRAEVEEAAARVGILAPTSARPEGLDTIVGDRAQKLSAGERRRIALARALLRAPDLLILDESTAHLDPVAARDFLDHLRRDLSGMTRILVTHDLAEARLADHIIVIDHGRILDEGAAAEVAARSRYFGGAPEAPRMPPPEQIDVRS